MSDLKAKKDPFIFRRNSEGIMEIVRRSQLNKQKDARAWFILYPDDALRRFWDVVIIFLLIYTIVVMPLRVGEWLD